MFLRQSNASQRFRRPWKAIARRKSTGRWISKHALCASRRRCGLTLIELLLASLIMAMFAAAISALAMAVQQNTQHDERVGTVTQHARVALQRIERAVSESTANEHFPGCVAFGEPIQGSHTPDTLVVWRGDISVADPNGTPRFNELVIYCPDIEQPNRLLEITVPDDDSLAPDLSDISAWRARLRAVKVSQRANKTELTDRLRTVPISTMGERRGVVRFEVTLRPSEKEWTDYRNGSVAWEDLKWVQGMHGGRTGLRQTWCRCELQLSISGGDSSDEIEIPFFGSSSRYFVLEQ